MKIVYSFLFWAVGATLSFAQETGFTPQWFQINLPGEVAPGWNTRDGGNARAAKVEGVYYLAPAQFKIGADTNYRKTAPQSLWAFWEEFVARCEARDFAGLQAMHTARGWGNVRSIVSTPEIREQWEQVHAMIHWVSPYMVLRAGENTWIAYCRLDGPPYAFAPYKLGWNQKIKKWEIDAPDFSPAYKKLALVMMNAGVEALSPASLPQNNSVAALDSPPPPPPAPPPSAPAPPINPIPAPVTIATTSALVMEDTSTPMRLPGPFAGFRFALPFSNRGQETVALIKAESSCSCIVPLLPQKPFDPDEKGELRAVFNPGYQQGIVRQSIVITTSEGAPEKPLTMSIPITFEVPLWVEVSSQVLWWKKDEPRASKQAKVVFRVPHFELQGLRALDESASAMETSVAPVPDEPGAYLVTFQPPATGRFTAVYELVTNQPDARGIQINVLAQ